LTDKKHILKSASIISLVTVVSRVLGYVRDQRITLLLGTTLSADAYVLAYRIPNLFRRLVAEGSMTASFIPVFSGYMQEQSREEVWGFANRLFWTLALVAAVISILGMVFSPAVVQVFSGANVARDQAVGLNRIIFPYLFFIALAALAMGILNCFHIFGLPAATPVMLNIATILFSLGIVWHHFKDAATSLAVGVLVGGVLQFLIQVPALVRKGMKFNFAISFSHPAIREVARLMLPRLFGIGIGQINLLIDTKFATAAKMPAGSLAALYVADRVMELVLGGYAIAVATAIIRVLFQHGQFVASSTRLTARALLYYAVGLPALATVKLVVPAFYSTKDTKTPVVVASISLVINIILNILFLQVFFNRVQNGGPALATALATFFDFFALLIIFRWRHGSMGMTETIRSFAKISLCSAIMAAACWVGNRYTAFTVHSRFLVQLVVFAGLLTGATALYLALAWIFRCHEIEEVYGIAIRRRAAGGEGGYAEA
jgi:putative peptidoglycan lipid II flippase